MLIIFGGLPGTGKTTTAKQLARKLSAVYLRIDTIENTLTQKYIKKSRIKDAGYAVAQEIALENLRFEKYVIVDSVNPLEITRKAWHKVAEKAQSPFLDVEFICSDPAEHRRRIENRKSDLSGFTAPSWNKVVNRTYERRNDERLICDTAVLSSQQAVDLINERLTLLMVHDAGHL